MACCLLLHLLLLSCLIDLSVQKGIKAGAASILRRKHNITEDTPDLDHDYSDYHDEDLKKDMTLLDHRERLVDTLLRIYNNLVFPGNDSVQLQIGLSLDYFIALDLDNEVLITKGRIHLAWHDERLVWNPLIYGGIERVAIPPHRIWKPSILIHNSLDEQLDGTFPTSASITYDGMVRYNPPGIFKSSCTVNREGFPFDQHTCWFRIGPVDDEGAEKLDLRFVNDKPEIIMTNYHNSPEWDVVGNNAAKSTRSDNCCSILITDVTFNLVVNRKSTLYVCTLLFPLITLSYILPLMFLIPPIKIHRIWLFVFYLLLPMVLRFWLGVTFPFHINKLILLEKYFVFVSLLGAIGVIQSLVQLAIIRKKRPQIVEEAGRPNINASSSGKSQESNVIWPTMLDKIFMAAYSVLIFVSSLILFFSFP